MTRQNTFLENVFLGPEGLRSGWRAAVYAAFFLILVTLLQALVVLFHFPFAMPGAMPIGILFTQEVIAAASAIAAAAIMGRMEGRRFGDFGMPPSRALRSDFWLGAAWGLAGISAVLLLIHLFGGYSFGVLALGEGAALRYAAIWAGVFFVVGISEEFLFRGYVQFTLAQGMTFWPAALLTSLVFGSVHLRNPGEGPIGALAVFVVGMFLCLTLRRTGQLWFAIGWHAAWDFGETYLYSVPNSGLVMPGHLLAASFHGPAWLTGGTVGPEGSVFDFVVLGAMAGIFALVYRHRPAKAEG